MIQLKEITDSLLHLLFPHICAGCGRDLLNEESMLCIHCLAELPETNFQIHANNPIEKIFWGRLPLVSATSQYYFTKESRMQQLMHEFKYRGNKELGLSLGRMMGDYLKKSNRFNVDALIPLPLHQAKERRRGYNQATVLCDGLSERMHVPVLKNALIRTLETQTQTKKGRVERWHNIEGKFKLVDAPAIINKHVLLVDDVVTTGATLEACGQEILQVPDTRLSIATLCYTARY